MNRPQGRNHRNWQILALAGLLVAAGCDAKDQKPAASAPDAPSEATADHQPVAEKERTAEPTMEPSSQANEKDLSPVDDIPAGTTKVYGANFTVIEPPVQLADAIAKQKKSGFDGPYKIAGKIQTVCKKRGCWFTLVGKDAKPAVHVQMKNYGFLVPRNSDGAAAIVEGKLTKHEISKEEARHFAAEASGKGEAPEAGPAFELTATTVEITKS